MERLTVTLPKDLGDYVHERIAGGEWASGEDYVRALVEADRERDERLRAAIQEGIDSGISPLSFEQIIQEARRRNGVAE